jgi:hypothetical protein
MRFNPEGVRRFGQKGDGRLDLGGASKKRKNRENLEAKNLEQKKEALGLFFWLQIFSFKFLSRFFLFLLASPSLIAHRLSGQIAGRLPG